MKSKVRKLLGVLILVCVLLTPLPARADQVTDIRIPSQAIKVVPEADLVELIYYMSAWKSGDLYAHLDAAEEILRQLNGQIREAVGSEVSLPDFAKIRRDCDANLETIRKSFTVAEAQQKVVALTQSASSVALLFSDEVEDMFTTGILDPVDLSLSTLEEPALPQVQVGIPGAQIPSLKMDLPFSLSAPPLNIQAPTIPTGSLMPRP